MRDVTLLARLATQDRLIAALEARVANQDEVLAVQSQQIEELLTRILYVMRQVQMTKQSKVAGPDGRPMAATSGTMDEWYRRDRESFIATLEKEAADAITEHQAAEAALQDTHAHSEVPPHEDASAPVADDGDGSRAEPEDEDESPPSGCGQNTASSGNGQSGASIWPFSRSRAIN